MIWRRENPAGIAADAGAGEAWVEAVKEAAGRAKLGWRETNYLLLRRGPYVVGAGLDESIPGPTKELRGRWVNLFDPELRVARRVSLAPGSRMFLLDLDEAQRGRARVLASACKALPLKGDGDSVAWTVEGITGTEAVVLVYAPKPPRGVTLGGQGWGKYEYSAPERLLWVRFPNESRPRELGVEF